MSAFRLPTRVHVEPGCLALLPAVAGERGARRVLLVTDQRVGAQPFAAAAQQSLEAAGVACTRFDAVEPNPRTTTVEALAQQARDEGAELVVGLGGGSVLDAAKAAAMLATNGGALLDYVGRERFTRPPLPFVAVPTTCGTGSEVTWVAVVTAADAATKVSVKGVGMFPDVALVDADLLADLPPEVLATTSMDALTHAIEAMTGREANPTSDVLATEAVALIAGHLERAVHAPAREAEARAALARAATFAGMAFGNSDVGAVHCLSETLGGLYDVPHGLANAVLLAPVQRYHLEVAAPALARLEARVSGRPATADHAAAFVERLERLAHAVGIPPFATLGVPRDAFDEVARRSVENGSNPSCPMRMTEADYRAILERVGG